MLHLLALLGILIISFSAVFVRLASVSPATAAFFRAAYAIPLLAALWAAHRGDDRRTRRDRLLAVASGLILAIDLTLWHEAIALIGAGLATVIANVQVVFVACAAWMLHGERPSRRTVLLIVVTFTGVALSSGLARHDAYGAAPVAGAILAVLGGASYAAFLLLFRRAQRTLGPTTGPLLDSTVGAAAGALMCAAFDPGFSLAPAWPAHGWLLALAWLPQTFGWLLIGAALPRLPAVETSIMLLGQPAITVIWGVLIFAEHLSPLQWLGAATVLAGVAFVSRQPSVGRSSEAPDGSTLRTPAHAPRAGAALREE